jgi:hypothetical protein
MAMPTFACARSFGHLSERGRHAAERLHEPKLRANVSSRLSYE